MKRFTLSLILALVLVAMAPSARATAPPMWDGQLGKPHDPYTMEPYPVIEKGFTATRGDALAARGSGSGSSGSGFRAWRLAYWPKVLAYALRLGAIR